MATVKGPLMSLDASGSIGTSIVFSKWKGRNYVRRHAIPANPKSSLQVSVRSVLRFLTQQWTNLSAADQADWDTRAAATNISPFNAFVGYNMERYGRFRLPSKRDPATEAGAIGVWESTVVEALVKSVQFTFKMSNARQNWGLLLFQGTPLDFTTGRSNVVRCLLHDDTEEMTFTLTGLQTAQEYFFNIAYFSEYGQLGDSFIELGPYTPT